MSLEKPRPVLSKEVFQAIHSLAHTGPRPTQRAIEDRYKRDIRRWAKNVRVAKQPKCTATSEPTFSQIPTNRAFSQHPRRFGRSTSPRRRNDIPLHHYRSISAMTRGHSLPDAKTPTRTNALIRGWISRFGVPADITSDRGPQFTSSLWSNINIILDIKQQHTTAYHSQANGI